MKDQSSENKLVITEEFILDQNKLSKDPNNHFKAYCIDTEHIDIVYRYLSTCKLSE